MLDEMRANGLASQMLTTLRTAHIAQTKSRAYHRYVHHGHLLYAHLLEILIPKKEETFDALLWKIRRATHPRDLEVPLWQYTACYYKTDDGDRVFDTRIGTKALGVPALPSESVYSVTHNTDILDRLASTYGADFYVYDRHADTLCETDQMVQTRREITLAYYPNGLPETLSQRVQDSYALHLTCAHYTPTWAETVSVAEPVETPPQSPHR